jgi:hypothetical protein
VNGDQATLRPSVGEFVLAAALALPLIVTSFERAGFTASARSHFVAAVAVSLVPALFLDEARALRALRTPAIATLLALGLLAVLSATWTIGAPAAAVRWGFVIVAYGGLAVAAAVLASTRSGLLLLFGIVAALALVQGLVGLHAAAVRALPHAERIGGSWRPGGSFEYPPALALLEVTALPILITTAVRGRATFAGASALGLATAAAVLAISVSRTQVAIAVLIVVAAIVYPAVTHRGARRSAIAAAVLMVVAGVVVHEIVGGYVAPHAHAGGSGRWLWTLVALLACAVVWVPLRRVVERQPGRRSTRLPRWRPSARVAVAAGLAVVLAAGAVEATSSPLTGRGIQPRGGFAHGRTHQWKAAVQTALDRPVAGSGADSYGQASLVHQGRPPVLYAHDLPLEVWAELGILGLLLVLCLYFFSALSIWQARAGPALWLAGPGAAAFLLTNLVDWPWHLPLAGAVFALTLGALAGSGREVPSLSR